MEKIDRLLEAIEHPERYSDDELQDLMNDQELASLYSFLCRENAYKYSGGQIGEDEIDRQWRIFNKCRQGSLFRRVFSRKCVAACVVVVTSFTIMGMGYSLAMKFGKESTAKESIGNADSPAETASQAIVAVDSVNVADVPSSVVFEDKSLHEILVTLSPHYGVKLRFDSDVARETHLFFKWDKSMPIDEVMSHLNTFNRISLKMQGDTIISK